VAAAAVGADRRRRQPLGAAQAVHEGRLADAGRTDERGGATAGDVRRDVVDTLAGHRRDHVHGDAERHA
jgi:hypothetical protein